MSEYSLPTLYKIDYKIDHEIDHKIVYETITQSIFEQEIAFWVNVHSTLVLSQTAFHRQQLQVYLEKGNLDHMARMAPTYLFVKRRGTVDRNPCSCCILLVEKTYWILPTGIYGTLSKDGMTT